MLEDKFCYSGGAFGSDFLFDQLGCELGYKTVIWSFRGHNRNETKNSIIKELTQKALNEKYYIISSVRKTLNRRQSSSQYIENLMLRNVFQITGIKQQTDLVIAIGRIKNNIVEGGTGYAVEVAKIFNKPIIVVDKINCQIYLYNYDSNQFEKIDINYAKSLYKQAKIFTGIGSREIDCDALKPVLRSIMGGE